MGRRFIITIVAGSTMTVANTLSRADQEIQRGRLWRAKEILSSSLEQYEYSPEIYRKYAEVLLLMGDDLEAGRFLLLSVDEPNESELAAIRLFVERYKNDGYERLLRRFPRSARLSTVESYPEYFRNYLNQLGAPESLVDDKARGGDTIMSRLVNGFVLSGCFVAVMFLGTCLALGLAQIWTWLFEERGLGQ